MRERVGEEGAGGQPKRRNCCLPAAGADLRRPPCDEGKKEKSNADFFPPSSFHFHHRESVKTGSLIYIYFVEGKGAAAAAR